jgi:hypothetical protein
MGRAKAGIGSGLRCQGFDWLVEVTDAHGSGSLAQWGGAASVVAIVTTTAAGAMVIANEGIHTDSFTAPQFGGSQAYYVTWCRVPAYLLGLLLGMAMHERGGGGVMGEAVAQRAACLAASAAKRMPAWAAATGQVTAVVGMAAAMSVIPRQAFVTPDGSSSIQNAAFIRYVLNDRVDTRMSPGWMKMNLYDEVRRSGDRYTQHLDPGPCPLSTRLLAPLPCILQRSTSAHGSS